MSNLTQLFSYHKNQLRTHTIDDKVWFAAKDVCTALGLKWNSSSLARIPESWRGVQKFRTPLNSNGTGGGMQTLIMICEKAVYKLAFSSHKPEADAFTDWVAGEVLPSIRSPLCRHLSA